MFACTAGEINRLIEKAKRDSLSDRSMYRQAFIDLRTRQMQELEQVLLCLLRTINTNGQLGTVANWQQHIVTFFVFIPGHEIEKLLNQPQPESCWPLRKSLEQQRIIVPTLRTSVCKGEDLRVGVIHSARLLWKQLSAKQFKSDELRHVNRAVWEGTIHAGDFTDDLEYYLETKTLHEIVRYPAGAPGRN